MKMFNALGTIIAATLLTAAPAFADPTTNSAMLIADIGREVDAVSGGTHADARIVRATPATYPDFERLAGQGGTITVDIVLDAQGNLTHSAIAGSSGHPRFDQSALAAVRSSTFAPATVNGHGVAGSYAVTVVFDPTN